MPSQVQPEVKEKEEVQTTEAGQVEAQVETSTPQEETNPHQEELAALKKQLEEANRRASEAEARSQTAHAEKASTESKLSTEIANRFMAQETAVDARYRNAQTGLAAAKAEYVRAQTEQRFEDAANLAEAIADYKTELKAADWDKNNLKALKDQAEVAASQPKLPSDPVEAFIAIIPGDASKRWLRAHPDILQKVATDRKERQRLFAYAQLAESEAGHAADSQGYFDFIEEKYGLKQAATQIQEVKTKTNSGRTASAAPSNRNTQTQEVGERVVKLDDVVRKLTANDRANARYQFPDKPEDEALKLYAHGLVISKQREPGFRPDIKL